MFRISANKRWFDDQSKILLGQCYAGVLGDLVIGPNRSPYYENIPLNIFKALGTNTAVYAHQGPQSSISLLNPFKRTYIGDPTLLNFGKEDESMLLNGTHTVADEANPLGVEKMLKIRIGFRGDIKVKSHKWMTENRKRRINKIIKKVPNARI